MVFSVELSKFEANIERDREEEVEDNMSTLFVQLTQVLMSHIAALMWLYNLSYLFSSFIMFWNGVIFVYFARIKQNVLHRIGFWFS